MLMLQDSHPQHTIIFEVVALPDWIKYRLKQRAQLAAEPIDWKVFVREQFCLDAMGLQQQDLPGRRFGGQPTGQRRSTHRDNVAGRNLALARQRGKHFSVRS